jgi:hypothetical protein
MSKKRNQNDSFIAFDGRLTPEIRRRLRAKRYELGLPFQRVASFFGVNWSTFRKWEQGPTESCELCYRPALEAFPERRIRFHPAFPVHAKSRHQAGQ